MTRVCSLQRNTTSNPASSRIDYRVSIPHSRKRFRRKGLWKSLDSISMFNFRQKPAESHNCSQSSPYLQHPSPYNDPTLLVSNPVDRPCNVLLAPPAALTIHSSSFAAQSPSSAAPLYYDGHQRSMSEFSGISQELPHSVTNSHLESSIPPPEGLGLPSSLFFKSPSHASSPPPQKSRPASPSKEKRPFLPTFSSKNPTDVKVETKSTRLADWFQGESAPVNLGVMPYNAKEKVILVDNPSTPSPNMPQRKSVFTPTSRPTTGTSRFSFFGSKASSPMSQAADAQDELCNLDIKAALFPGGSADPFSPSSFKNLLQNAEGLLLRMQTAHKERTLSLRDIKAEKEAQSEELEEAQTRARHLKLQLDDMSVKLAEQDVAMMSLVDEVAAMKKWRQDEENKKSIRLVEADDETRVPRSHRPRKRESRDSGFESQSEDETPTSSVFSTPRDRETPMTSINTSPSIESQETFNDCCYQRTGAKTLPPLITAIKSGHQGLESDSTVRATYSNREGTNASEALGIVSMLQLENTGLKQRVEYLESTLDGCLDLVNGLGIR